MEDNFTFEQAKENEIILSSEDIAVVEQKTSAELQPQTEESLVSGDTEKLTNKPNKSKINNNKTFGLSASMIGIVMAVVVVVTMITGGGSNYKAKINNLNVFGNSFDYSINVDFEYKLDKNAYVDFQNVDTGIRMLVVNSVDSIIIPLKASEDNSKVVVEELEDNLYKVAYVFFGNVSGLIEGTRYKVQLVGDENDKTKVYYDTEIKTTGGKITRFDDIEYKCNCLIDNTFTFKINYIDENNYYKDFSYSLVNYDNSIIANYENIAIDNPNKTQIIKNITSLDGGTYKLIVRYYSNAYTDTGDKTSATYKLIEKIIDIKI